MNLTAAEFAAILVSYGEALRALFSSGGEDTASHAITHDLITQLTLQVTHMSDTVTSELARLKTDMDTMMPKVDAMLAAKAAGTLSAEDHATFDELHATFTAMNAKLDAGKASPAPGAGDQPLVSG